ncbi:ABC transporter permease [Streptomyces sp. KLOTTS4A1]|uniref:ABC transporter permease n=1 Tax=Streptomyces sp. KLOTTS4A1 TaxID=3390996 RepID=UPI0039F5EC0B
MSDLSHADATATATAETAAPAVQEAEPTVGKPRSLAIDALMELRRSPIFLISATMILLVVTMALFPGLFTDADPRHTDLANKYLMKPSYGDVFDEGWLGYDGQSYSIWARMVHGTRASLMVGLLTTLISFALGVITGMLAGFYGGWVDTVLSRIVDIFMAIPFLLGAMVILTPFEVTNPMVVVFVLSFFGWTLVARVMRGSVITVKQQDYVAAARALGAGTGRILMKHILPNAISPAIVIATISLGGYIGAEAVLSFLGVGLEAPTISWGMDINSGGQYIRNAPHVIFWPSLILSFTILAFIMLGEAVRDAFDPKSR